MGVCGAESAAALNSVANITENIIALVQATSTGGIIGAVGGVVAGLGSLVFGGGPDPAEQQRQQQAIEARRANTEALRKLTTTMAEQLTSLPLGNAAAISGAITRALAAANEQIEVDRADLDQGDFTSGSGGTQRRGGFMELLQAELLALGLSMDQVRALAEGMNQTLVESEGGFADFQRALAELDLSAAFKTFAGRLGLLRREFELFDQEPMDRVQGLLDVLDEFTDIDVPSAADGKGAIDDFIQGFFNGIQDLSPEDMMARFGGLSLDQILDLLGDIEGILDGVDEDEVAKGVTKGFQVSRTITEVTGNRLVGVMSTVSFWAERTALASEAQLVLMGGGLLPPTRTEFDAVTGAPITAASSGDVSIGTITIGDIIVTGVSDPTAAAEAVARDLAEHIDETLGARMQDTRRARGLDQPDGLRN